MHETSTSLLERLRREGYPDDWSRFRDLYAPLLRLWMKRYDVADHDVDDLTQEVFLAVTKDVASFDHNGRRGAFRTWLKRILLNRLREFWRSRNRNAVAGGGSDVMLQLQKLEDPRSELSQIWDREHDRHVLQRLLEFTEPNFAPKTWKAFWLVVIDGRSADEAAAELEVSLNAVFVAKSRVISRLREEANGLVESSSSFLAMS